MQRIDCRSNTLLENSVIHIDEYQPHGKLFLEKLSLLITLSDSKCFFKESPILSKERNYFGLICQYSVNLVTGSSI